MSTTIPVADAMQIPESRAMIEQMISLFRMIIGPILSNDPERIPENQSYAITAAAMFAGTTVGHMIAVGAMNEQDKARAVKVMTVNFRNGIEVGKSEARKAMLEQMPSEGRA